MFLKSLNWNPENEGKEKVAKKKNGKVMTFNTTARIFGHSHHQKCLLPHLNPELSLNQNCRSAEVAVTSRKPLSHLVRQ